VAPTRFVDGMPSNYIENQTLFFVDPFVKAYKELGRKKPLLLQIILTDQMLKDRSYTEDVLNWVTGIDQIEGVYLIYKHDRARKQVQDIDFILSVDFFVRSLKKSGMVVVMGYMNTESVPLMCAEPDIMTFGSYENLRMFSTLSFEEPNTDRQPHGPNARVYVARLLQWVEHEYLGAIKREINNLEGFIDDNAYRAAMFEPTFKWHFSKSEPYMHYFVSFSDQFRRLSSVNGDERVQLVKIECKNAIDQYAMLENVVFDSDSGGRHLTSWLTFLNQR
jgi:hypothetical protein